MADARWKSVQLPNAVMRRIDERVKAEGIYSSRAEFVKAAVVEKLRRGD